MNPNPSADLLWSGVDWAGTDFDDLELCDLRTLPSDSSTAPSTVPALPTLPRSRRTSPLPTRSPRPVRSRRPRPRPLRSVPTATPAPAVSDAGRVRSVLLIDLENVCSGSRRPTRILAQLRCLLAAAGEVDEVLAIASTAVLRRQEAVLALAGIPTRPVRCGPDAADRALLEAARSYAARGATTFHVASADHFFAQVASLGRLNVITVPGRPVSARLVRAASSVSVAA